VVINAARLAEFQSTRPARGATNRAGGIAQIIEFQSTRPARGATPGAAHPAK